MTAIRSCWIQQATGSQVTDNVTILMKDGRQALGKELEDWVQNAL